MHILQLNKHVSVVVKDMDIKHFQNRQVDFAGQMLSITNIFAPLVNQLSYIYTYIYNYVCIYMHTSLKTSGTSRNAGLP